MMRAAVAALSVVVIALLVIWRLAVMTPDWYEPPPDTQTARDKAGQFETRLVEEAHNIRPPHETWKVRLRQQQVNEWLATRLPMWIVHDPELVWPEELGTVQVRFTQAGIDIAAQIHLNHENSAQFIVARLVPQITDAGVGFQLEQAGVGRLMLPGDPLARLTDQLQQLQTEALRDDAVLQLLEDFTTGRELLDRDIDLADNRTVRIIDVQCRDQSLIVEMQTLSANSSTGNIEKDQTSGIQ